MAKGKQRAWHVLDGLYRDVEDARRHYEHGTNPEGAAAYERWLEVLLIAEEYLSEDENAAGDGDVDLEGNDTPPGDDAGGPDESGPQLVLPGTGRVDDDVPRGTLQRNSEAVPLVGTYGVRPVTHGANPRKVTRRGT